MDFAEMLRDAFSYMREGVFSNRNRWLKLILAVICLGLPFNGYMMRVYRGTTPAPEVEEWGSLFVDGIKMFVVGIVYAIPLLILWVLIYGSFFLGLLNGNMNDTAMRSWEPNMILMLLFYIVEFVVTLLLPVAYIRFARSGSFGEAFNISGVLETIGKIGWLQYIVAYILVTIVVSIPILVLVFGCIILGGAALLILKGSGLLIFIALIGIAILLILILIPLFGVFQARYMTRLYDSPTAATPVQ